MYGGGGGPSTFFGARFSISLYITCIHNAVYNLRLDIVSALQTIIPAARPANEYDIMICNIKPPRYEYIGTYRARGDEMRKSCDEDSILKRRVSRALLSNKYCYISTAEDGADRLLVDSDHLSLLFISTDITGLLSWHVDVMHYRLWFSIFPFGTLLSAYIAVIICFV